MQYTTLTHLPNGNIRFTLTTEGKELYDEMNAADEDHPMKNDEDYFLDLIEWHLCNGLHLLDNAKIGCLTESLILSTEPIDYESTEIHKGPLPDIWYFNEYMVQSYMDALNSQWGIEFTKA